jgi:hypothetical protein
MERPSPTLKVKRVSNNVLPQKWQQQNYKREKV